MLKVSLSELQEVLLKRYIKHANITTEIYVLHKLTQQIGQQMRNYIECIRKQALKCKFGTFEYEACKDQLVPGVIDGSLRKRLLLKDNLTFDKACDSLAA